MLLYVYCYAEGPVAIALAVVHGEVERGVGDLVISVIRSGEPQSGHERSGHGLHDGPGRYAFCGIDGPERGIPSRSSSVVLHSGDGDGPERAGDVCGVRGDRIQIDGVIAEPGREDHVGVSLSAHCLYVNLGIRYLGPYALCVQVDAYLHLVLHDVCVISALDSGTADLYDLLDEDCNVSDVPVQVVVVSVRSDLERGMLGPVVDDDLVGRIVCIRYERTRSAVEQDGVRVLFGVGSRQYSELIGIRRAVLDQNGSGTAVGEVSSRVPELGLLGKRGDGHVLSAVVDVASRVLIILQSGGRHGLQDSSDEPASAVGEVGDVRDRVGSVVLHDESSRRVLGSQGDGAVVVLDGHYGKDGVSVNQPVHRSGFGLLPDLEHRSVEDVDAVHGVGGLGVSAGGVETVVFPDHSQRGVEMDGGTALQIEGIDPVE